ncbi:hypothetical protein ACKI16_29800 [Streptomyces scabiei]|uniref:hypothetical protein n=1 Tax=Streptomyces scabiei TaxID=1930 RepID=UPI0038F6D2AD
MALLEGGCRESDAELAYRLSCRPALVAQARAVLGMPAMPQPPGRYRSVEQLVMLGSSELTPNGHRRWTGRVTRDGVPILSNSTTVARAVFRMLHGRAPEGQVQVDCTMAHCVEGAHLTDRRMRQERAAVGAAGAAR